MFDWVKMIVQTAFLQCPFQKESIANDGLRGVTGLQNVQGSKLGHGFNVQGRFYCKFQASLLSSSLLPCVSV